MSSTSSVGVTSFQAPSFNEASGVLAKIEDQIGSVQNLFASVQQIMAEIQALQASAPDPKAFGFGTKKFNAEAYNAAVAAFQQKLASLNQKLEESYRKLGQGQALLARLQQNELPAAERRDAQRMEKAMKDATEALNNAAKAIADTGKTEEAGTSAQEASRIEIRVREKKIEIRLDKEPTFKEVISAFQLMAVVVGQSTPERKFSRMPPPAGGGLPPISTP